ncbi:MAG: hypothetical protein HY094_10240 [Candidatus Melainabacteria bacterium]|nr:hypothetical protein [Candidatus Melainabacteria bacterium]
MRITDLKSLTTTTTSNLNNPKLSGFDFDLALLKEDPNKEVRFFVKSTHTLTQDEIEKLKKEGCTIVNPIADGIISTASAKLGSILQISALDFVDCLQMGSKVEES